MGKTVLDRLLRRSLKVTKFKPTLNLAITRLAVLKKQREVRCSNARSDVLQLLQLGHHDRALLRVEHVIKEQNMLDAYVMMESYCNLLIERASLIEQEKECPEELKQAISTLIYAASRCGDFPEIQEMRAAFASHYGKEFAARAVELRNNCAVNPKMIQKLSTRQPSLENRMKVLKEIAVENGVALNLEEPSNPTEGQSSAGERPSQAELESSSSEKEKYDFSDSTKARKYKDVADAAQAAFQSAAYAAAAARVAVELSRSRGPHDSDGDSNTGAGKVQSPNDSDILKLAPESEERESHNDSQGEGPVTGSNMAEVKQSLSSSSSDSGELEVGSQDMLSQANQEHREIHFDEYDEPVKSKEGMVDTRNRSGTSPQKEIPPRFQAGLSMEPDYRGSVLHIAEAPMPSAVQLNLEKRPMSVRTRGVRGY